MFVQIEDIVKKLKTKKSKNIIYLLIFIVLGGWFAYRFYTVANERNTDVFNIIRNDAEYGTPVEIMQIHKTDGVLYEPITIKNNKAYVSSARVKMFRANQTVGNCKIFKSADPEEIGAEISLRFERNYLLRASFRIQSKFWALYEVTGV